MAEQSESKKESAYDSFDDLPEEVEDNEAWMNNHVSTKKKSDRQKLKGFACHDCAEYYKSQNLPEETLKKLVQKCSRHRAKIPPTPNSPKEMWKLDIEGPDPETKVLDEPLKTRAWRRHENMRALILLDCEHKLQLFKSVLIEFVLSK